MRLSTLPAGRAYPTIRKALAEAGKPKYLKAECEALVRIARHFGDPVPIFRLYHEGIGGAGDRYIIDGYEGETK